MTCFDSTLFEIKNTNYFSKILHTYTLLQTWAIFDDWIQGCCLWLFLTGLALSLLSEYKYLEQYSNK